MDRRDFIKSAAMLPMATLPIEDDNKVILNAMPIVTVLSNMVRHDSRPIIIISGTDQEGYNAIVDRVSFVINELTKNSHYHAGIIGLLNDRDVVSVVSSAITERKNISE